MLGVEYFSKMKPAFLFPFSLPKFAVVMTGDY